jgi:hypothetical protein
MVSGSNNSAIDDEDRRIGFPSWLNSKGLDAS